MKNQATYSIYPIFSSNTDKLLFIQTTSTTLTLPSQPLGYSFLDCLLWMFAIIGCGGRKKFGKGGNGNSGIPRSGRKTEISQGWFHYLSIRRSWERLVDPYGGVVLELFHRSAAVDQKRFYPPAAAFVRQIKSSVNSCT